MPSRDTLHREFGRFDHMKGGVARQLQRIRVAVRKTNERWSLRFASGTCRRRFNERLGRPSIICQVSTEVIAP